MDLSKAFDCLPHDLLLAKLLAYGMSTQNVVLLSSYLRHRAQRVKIGSVRSEWGALLKGVPQGSVLGPALFNIYLNDIVYALHKSSLANFADDNTLIACEKNIEDTKTILEEEGKLAIKWFQSNQMKPNQDKFHYIQAGKIPDDSTNHISIQNNHITAENEVKILGVIIDTTLQYKKQISEVCKKAGRQINALRRISPFLNNNAKLTAFRCFIRSHFNYSPLIWLGNSNTHLNKIEKLQERALRIVYNDYKTDYSFLLKRANVHSMSKMYDLCLLKEVYKSVNNENPTYICEMFTKRTSDYALRGKNVLKVWLVKSTNNGLHSFQYKGSKLWNSLTDQQRTAESVHVFMSLLK